MEFLLAGNADPQLMNVQQKTALQIASEAGHDRVKELLLRSGARE